MAQDTELKPGWLQRDIERAIARVNRWENGMTDTTGPTLSERTTRDAIANFLALNFLDREISDLPEKVVPLSGDISAQWVRQCADSLIERFAAALDAQAALVKELAEALVSLIEMPSACTSDGDVLENNRRRGAARAALTKYKAAQP